MLEVFRSESRLEIAAINSVSLKLRTVSKSSTVDGIKLVGQSAVSPVFDFMVARWRQYSLNTVNNFESESRSIFSRFSENSSGSFSSQIVSSQLSPVKENI